MNESQISVRYARALFLSASEKNKLDGVYKDMQILAETCALDDFRYMLAVPTLKSSKKSELTSAIMEKHLDELSMSLIKLVIQNRREQYLPGISRNFCDMYRKKKGIRTASLQTAEQVDDTAIQSIRELLSQAFDSDVELTSGVKEELIGGFVLTIEDKQYDASVATGLRKIRKELLETRTENK